MSRKGLPDSLKTRSESHYVEALTSTHRSIGRTIPIKKVEPNPEQPRSDFGDLTELTGSIKSKGVLEPILVKPDKKSGTWMIIAGERRWRAAQLAGLEEIPCIELDIDENEIAEIALVENMQRKDLTVWEVADGLASLADRLNYTHEQIAAAIGKSRTTVTEFLTISRLPGKIRRKCLDQDISAKSALLDIARQFDEPAMHSFIEDLSDEKPGEDRKSSSRSETSSGSRTKTDCFDYRSYTNTFEIRIKFLDEKTFAPNDVLRALKETFEDVKLKRDAPSD